MGQELSAPDTIERELPSEDDAAETRQEAERRIEDLTPEIDPRARRPGESEQDHALRRMDELFDEFGDPGKIIEGLKREGLWIEARETPKQKAVDQVLHEAREIGKHAKTEFESFQGRLSEDEDLSDVGQQKKLDEKAVELLASIEKGERAIDAAEREHAEVRSSIDAAGKVDADAIESQLLIERRQALARMTPDQRLKVVSGARIAGDVDLLRAVVQVPAYVTGITDVTWEMCREKLIELHGSHEIDRANKLRGQIDSTKRSLSESRDFIRRHTSREGRKRAGEFFTDEMTASEKAEFIKKFGLEAWRKVVDRSFG
jgi:hypothetical protein